MKKVYLLALGVCLLGLAVPSAEAAKAKKNKGGTDVFAKYDKNGNGVLDSDEKDAVKAAFSSDADLKKFDLNGDGKLDDAELGAMKPEGKKKKKNK